MIHFLFLGTSAGVPTRSRNVTSLAVHIKSFASWTLVDCGEGTQRQLLGSKCSLAKVDQIFLTHLHGDHVLGLPGLLSTRKMYDIRRPLTIIGPKGLRTFLDWSLQASESHLDYPVSIVELQGDTAQICYSYMGFRVTALPLKHSVPSFAYLWEEEKPKRPFLLQKAKQAGIPPGPYYKRLQHGQDVVLPNGNRFSGEEFLGPPQAPVRFIVGGDNADPRVLEPYLAGVQLLIHEATYTEADFVNLPKVQMHSTAKRVAEVAAAVGLPHLVLTHFSPRYGDAGALAKLREEAAQAYRGDLYLAEDFAEFELTGHNAFNVV